MTIITQLLYIYFLIHVSIRFKDSIHFDFILDGNEKHQQFFNIISRLNLQILMKI